VGDLNVLTTTNESIYSFLRVSEEEAVLVLVNLGDQPVESVWLTKSQSSLKKGVYTPVPVLGEGAFVPIKINEQGGLFHLFETPQIPPNSTFILQLQQNYP